MAAAVSVKGRVECGSSEPLFAVAVVGGGYLYDVSADAQPFLVRTAPTASDAQPLTVVQAGLRRLKKR